MITSEIDQLKKDLELANQKRANLKVLIEEQEKEALASQKQGPTNRNYTYRGSRL